MLSEDPTPIESLPQRLVIWLSLDSLQPFWMAIPPFDALILPVRHAAQDAVRRWHNGAVARPETMFFDALTQTMPEPSVTTIRQFFDCVAQFDSNHDIGYWQSWVSQNQHRPDVPGMDAATAMGLMKKYQDDVAKKNNVLWAKIAAAIKATPLSDWDLFIHATYCYCTDETSQFAESLLLSGLSSLQYNLLFNTFVAQHILTLPAADQDHLLHAVQAEWADLWSEPMSGLPAAMQTETAADAAKIRPASGIVVWS
jgi:hypothetical protein